MPDPKICPLCGNSAHELIVIEKLSYDDIRYIYRSVYRIDVAADGIFDLHLLRCQDCDLRFYWPQISGDPAFYERLQEFPWYYLEDKAEYHIANRLIPSGSSVLEIGCGSGCFASFLPEGCNYRGLEYNTAAIEKAKGRGLKIDCVSIESFAQSFESSFDVVCSFQVLEHVISPAEFLKKAARVLAPGGLLIIAVPAEDSFMAEEINNVLNMPPHHLTRWTDSALTNVSRIIGLQLVALEHEEVSDFNMPSLAKVQILRVVRQTFGIHVPMISRIAHSFPIRLIFKILSFPIATLGMKSGKRPAGHSVVAAYKKGL